MTIRILKNKRAMSPAISGIILVAVSITYGLVAASWLGEMTVSVMSLEELKITNCEWTQDYAHADLSIKNIGTQGATLSSLQINGELIEDFTVVEGNLRINPGRTSTIRVSQSFDAASKYEFKLTTKRQTPVRYVSISQSTTTETPNEASIHYINSISNIDESPDKGQHSNFANQQHGPDNLFNTISEADYGAGLTSIVRYPNIDQINYGTRTDFVNAQDVSPDGDYLTIQEENLGGDSVGYPTIRSKVHSMESSSTKNHEVNLPQKIDAGDTLLVVFVCDDNEQITWEKEWNVIYENAGKFGPTMSIAWKKATGKEVEKTITIQTKRQQESTHMSYAIQNANDPTITPPEASPPESGTGRYPDAKKLSPSGGLKSYLWLAFYGCDRGHIAEDYPGGYQDNRESYKSSKYSQACAIGAATKEYTASNDDTGDFRIKNKDEWEAVTVVIYPEQAEDDYELEFEYQWTNVEYEETTEKVCIYVQTASQNGEKLVAYEWNGATWQALGTLTSDGWNNFTTSILTGPTYAINIRDEDKSNDVTQSSWKIDCIITDCSSTETNYELDIEVQFTDVDVNKNYEKICIYVGSTTSEPLDVFIWDEGTWEVLASDLTKNQWKNMTQTITQSTVTLRFLDSIETNDPIEDSWEIDSVLLYGPP